MATSSPPPGLRERKKQRTRQAIADAAVELFERQGFDATPVEQIADRADVSMSTFFRYFPSKEAAVFPDADERSEVALELLERWSAEGSLARACRASSLAMADRDLERRDQLARQQALVAREPALARHALRLTGETTERFAATIAARLGVDVDRDLRPRLVAAATFGALNAAYAAWLAHEDADLRALIEQAYDVLDRGFEQALR